MTTAVDETLAEILSVVLERPVAPGLDLSRADEPKWDSLKHLEIIFAVEAAFDVAFTPEEMAEVTSVAGLKAKALGSDAP